MDIFDQAALERLYAELERPLYNVVYRWLWNADDAMEVVQEAFLRVWKMRARVDPATASPLVYRVALNLASNRRRRRKVARWVGLAEDVATDPDDPERLLGAESTRLDVRRAIDALPDKLRRVVTLCELGGLSYREVADTLRIPMGTVASRRSAALEKLRGSLEAAHG